MNILAKAFSIATLIGSTLSNVYAQEPIKIAFIDPLSGPFAATGESALAHYQYAVEELVNKKGGVLEGASFEIVPFDNKISAKESLIQLQIAIDQGIRIIAQGNSSGVANALSDAINKHNKRNPEKRVIYLNYSAVDPALTNEKCNFWHFRFDAHADMKMDALTDIIKANDAIKKVYLIGQDYSFGKAVAHAAVTMLKEKRPDIEIVGNELHPIGKVKDFTPYARKIINAKADAVITGNWGADMVGLGKAIIAAGFNKPIYTYYASGNGITKTFGEAGKGTLKLVAEGQLNPPPSPQAKAYTEGFKTKYPDFDIGQPRIASIVEILAKAINKAGTAHDMAKVAFALEGMEHRSMWGTKMMIRKQDHQAIQDIHILAHTDEDITFDLDNSGYGLRVENTVKQASAHMPTTCQMQRP